MSGFAAKTLYSCRAIKRSFSSTARNTDEYLDAMNKISKVLLSSPRAVLDAALDESGVRVSLEMAEDILKRFENAGMVAYRFFLWTEKQRRFQHNVRTHHLVIGGLAKIRQYELMWDVVNSMRKKGLLLNVETFCIIMRKYARAGKIEEAIYTFNVMDKHGVDINLAAFNGLISALCKSKNVEKAQELFYSYKNRFSPDAKTYSMLIEGWGKSPNLPKAREVFREMIEDNCEPDIVTYGIMVDVLCKAGRMSEATDIIEEMKDRNCKPTSFIYSVLIHTYGVEKRVEDAVATFFEMEKNGISADVAAYNALIGCFCKANKIMNVKKVLKDMNAKGVVPNVRTYNIVISHLVENEEEEEALKLFRKMMKVCEPDCDTYTMMIKVFCGKKKVDVGIKVWKLMKKRHHIPSMHTYQVLINGLCERSETAQACVLMEDMIEKGMRPSGTTLKRLRVLLLKEGREDVLKFLQEKANALVKEPMWD